MVREIGFLAAIGLPIAVVIFMEHEADKEIDYINGKNTQRCKFADKFQRVSRLPAMYFS
jgi:hypothetical protein